MFLYDKCYKPLFNRNNMSKKIEITYESKNSTYIEERTVGDEGQSSSLWRKVTKSTGKTSLLGNLARYVSISDRDKYCQQLRSNSSVEGIQKFRTELIKSGTFSEDKGYVVYYDSKFVTPNEIQKYWVSGEVQTVMGFPKPQERLHSLDSLSTNTAVLKKAPSAQGMIPVIKA